MKFNSGDVVVFTNTLGGDDPRYAIVTYNTVDESVYVQMMDKRLPFRGHTQSKYLTLIAARKSFDRAYEYDRFINTLKALIK